MEPEQSLEVITQSPSYTVDTLFTRMEIMGQGALWKKVDTIIRVQGKVIGLKPKSYKGFSYFGLKGVNSTVTVKCPTNRLPVENENIIIEGMPILKASYNNSLEVQIEGEPIGKVTPVDYIDEVIEIKKDVYVRFDKLLGAHSLNTLKFFGSETALRDVFSQLPHYINQTQSQIIVVSDKDRILEALKTGLDDASAFCIVRGGADQTLDIWDDARFVNDLLSFDIPFYVALGHTHQIGLVAQYADESFSTPSILGSTINDILDMQAYVDNLDSTVERLGKDNEKTIAELTQKHASETAKLNEMNQTEILKLKRDGDAKFELMGKEHAQKLTKLNEKNEHQFQTLTKENKAQIESIHKSYQDKIVLSEKELRSKAEAKSLVFEKKLSSLQADKDKQIQNIADQNRREVEKLHYENNQATMQLMNENKSLALKLEGIRPRKPFIEWIVIGVMVLLSIYLYFD